MTARTLVLLALSGALLSACATVGPGPVSGTGSQLEIRQMQTREYDVPEKRSAMRSVIATLQDLGFTIDSADLEVGTVTATRHRDYTMRITVTVRERSADAVAVRANARIGERNVEDARTYQDFFAALDKSMFLTAQKVD